MTVFVGGLQGTHAVGESTNGAQAIETGDCESGLAEVRELLAPLGDEAVWGMSAQLYLMEPCISEDPMKVVEFFKSAAERGNNSAAVVLYSLYQGKPGLPANKTKALHWLTVAAERGNAIAAYLLGMHYHEHDTLERSPEKAVHWLKQAALKKHGPAQISLSTRLAQEGELDGAVMWAILARAGGDPRAEPLLEKLHQDATADEFAEGEARAARCLASDYGDCDSD